MVTKVCRTRVNYLSVLRDFPTTLSYICSMQNFEPSVITFHTGRLQLRTIIDMSQKRSDTTPSINSSRPNRMPDPPEADHNANSTTDATNPQAPLSSHWEELTDSDGRTFYANHATRSTSGRRPNVEIERDDSSIQKGLPPAWQALVDDDGKAYYANH